MEKPTKNPTLLIRALIPQQGCRIYSINRPGRLLNFWTLRVGAY